LYAGTTGGCTAAAALLPALQAQRTHRVCCGLNPYVATALIGACRFDTIVNCDHLLVLSNGQLVEQSLCFCLNSYAAAAYFAACRIDTILDCDHLLVLSNGQLVEQGAPKELAAQTGGQGQGQPGMFASMVEAAKAAAAGHHH
jgi:ABC-type bacteriocin/lantibiotic exporter with double-glycine peptidase domain